MSHGIIIVTYTSKKKGFRSGQSYCSATQVPIFSNLLLQAHDTVSASRKHTPLVLVGPLVHPPSIEEMYFRNGSSLVYNKQTSHCSSLATPFSTLCYSLCHQKQLPMPYSIAYLLNLYLQSLIISHLQCLPLYLFLVLHDQRSLEMTQ